MNAHIDLYQEVEYIVEMDAKKLEKKSISELTEFKTQLKNVYRRIKTDRERFDKTKSFYRDSGYRMNDLKEKIDDIKKIIKHKKKPEKKIEDLSKKPKHEYFIIAELLATNKIEIHEKKIFQYKDIKYKSGAELGRVINSDFGTKNKAFEQYLNDFKSQTGGKYFLEILDKENNLDEKNVKILKKVFEYFSDNQIEPMNNKFLDSFEILKEKNLI
jgi:hypothetical protein|tara:strand:+ start:2361 stop:3005 length:645 start_codon:yes stop_codon:yes gene_type:complete